MIKTIIIIGDELLGGVSGFLITGHLEKSIKTLGLG